MMESKNNDDGWAHIDFDKELEVGDRIGGGGVGVIYKGWFKNEPVALKTLFDARVGDDLKKEYMDELLVMSKVRHSNIVTFLGACMVPPNLCFVMEMCEASLFALLHENRLKFTSHEKMQMAVDVGSAMEYLHSLKPSIIHRDLKSHNVLRAMDGKLKVCDFGLVSVKHTQAGTPAYMAPELLENKHFNKSVDVYAFGVLLNELFTGEVPFFGIDLMTIRERCISGERPHMPSYGIPPKVQCLIVQCWSQNSEDRPGYCDVVDDLLEIYDTLPEETFVDNMENAGSADALDSLLSYK